jgi:protein-S-isoprenylcysteine O-methyltransferase Ste14
MAAREDLLRMKNLLRYALGLLGILLGTCATAHALMFRYTTPEVDPSLAISALTLLAGSLAVLGVRRGK